MVKRIGVLRSVTAMGVWLLMFSFIVIELAWGALLPEQQPLPLALDGYCSVSLVEREAWVAGQPRFETVHEGQVYRFASIRHLRSFQKDPEAYAPVDGGADVVELFNSGRRVAGDRRHGLFFGKRIYLFKSEASLDKFTRNPTQFAKLAASDLALGR